MRRTKFNFYRTWYYQLCELPNRRDAVRVLYAISDLLCDGKDTRFKDPVVQSTWESIKKSKEFGKEVSKHE